MIVALVEGDCEMNVLRTLVQRDRGKVVKCIDMKGKSHIVRLRERKHHRDHRGAADSTTIGTS